MLDLTPEEIAYVCLVVGKQPVTSKHGISAYEKLYDAVIQTPYSVIHMHDLEEKFPQLNRAERNSG